MPGMWNHLKMSGLIGKHKMKLSYQQMVVGLDKLFFCANLNESQSETIERANTIEAYIESCGYTWKDITDYMANEDHNEKV
jgi:hypothetical protein